MTLLEMVGGDPALLHEVGSIFLADYRSGVAKMNAACAAGDRDRLYSIVHSLKGSAASFGDQGAVALAQDIEHACRSGDLGGVAPLAQRFGAALDALAGRIAEELAARRF